MYECHCEDCKKAPNQLSATNEKMPFQRILNLAEKALKRLYEKGSYQPNDLLNVSEFREVIEETANVFSSTIPHQVPQEMRAYLEKDAFIFSGLRTHAQLAEARSLLKDEKGNIRPYHQFEKDVLKLNEKYNRNYLQAEHQFAVSSSQSAANWANLDKDGRYNLQYRTAGDDRVRDNHRVLHDITLPQDDNFWLSYYPPNGWRCRCRVVEVLKDKYEVSDSQKAQELGEKATTHIGMNGKNKLEIFRFNPGAEQKIFPPKHPYNKVKGAEEVKKALEEEIKKTENTQFTPQEIEKYEDELGVKIDRRIFEHLQKETPLLFTNPKGITGSGAYYSPYYNAVKIPIDNRRKASKWYAEAVVYHEFGHAADNHIGLTKNPIVTDLMNKYIKTLNLREIDTRTMKFQRYASRTRNYDLMEKVGAVRDTIMALNSNYGMGHTKTYYKQSGNREAEFIAHAFENAYAGNEVFKKVMPELYEEMIKMIKETKPK